MWVVNGNDLKMAEGDYGVILPIKITGMTFGASDSAQLVIKNKMNGEVLITKTFTNIQNNTINLELTQAESEMLTVGTYYYRLDAYQDGNYLNNLIPYASLKVVDVA